MFGISFEEIFIILFVAIIVLKVEDVVRIVKFFRHLNSYFMAFVYQIKTIVDEKEDVRDDHKF